MFNSIKHKQVDFLYVHEALKGLLLQNYCHLITLLLLVTRRWWCARWVPRATWLWRLKYLQCVHLFLGLSSFHTLVDYVYNLLLVCCFCDFFVYFNWIFVWCNRLRFLICFTSILCQSYIHLLIGEWSERF
jgi:hypothetical protein